jgi:outer membrane protein OmpA-like peptidoglycan-associated protein
MQPKLAVSTPGDIYEQEADHISEQVMRMPQPKLQRACACGGGCPGCQTEQPSQERLQTKHAGSGDLGHAEAPPIVHEVLRSPGQPLDTANRAFMEQRFGHDFSQVRVHADTKAAESASAVKALAYTVGLDVVFGARRYAPGTIEGDRLLAHELTHVVQQSGEHEVQGSNGPLFVSESWTRIQRDTADKQERHSELKRIDGAAKALSNGVIVWAMWVFEGGNEVIMSMSFTPYKEHRGKTITFLQTMLESGGSSSNAELDVLTYGKRDTATDDFEPFYGANWNNKDKNWVAEGAPGRFKNQPGGLSDPNAYFFDVPVVYSGQKKMFETAVVIPETTEVLAFIKWGAEGHDDEAKPILPPSSEPSDRPTAGFLVAVDRAYEQPSAVGPDILRPQRYDAILDRFPPNDATLTADQKKSLDPITAKVKERNDPTIYVSLGGFADATEKDPSGISEARAKAVESYLIAQGVPKASIVMAGFFGASWARFPQSPKEDRNRRVQVRVHWGPPRN